MGRAVGIWSRASGKLFSLEARIKDQVKLTADLPQTGLICECLSARSCHVPLRHPSMYALLFEVDCMRTPRLRLSTCAHPS